MEQVYEAYLGYLGELGGVLDELTVIARNKTDAAHRGDLEAMDACMKQEQVFSMTLRSMDQKRTKMLGEMGLQSVPLSGLAENYPQELRLRATQAAEAVLMKYDTYIGASNAAYTALECVLKDIERMMPEGQGQAANEAPAPPPRLRTDFRA